MLYLYTLFLSLFCGGIQFPSSIFRNIFDFILFLVTVVDHFFITLAVNRKIWKTEFTMHIVNKLGSSLVQPTIKDICKLLIWLFVFLHNSEDLFLDLCNWYITFKRFLFCSHLFLEFRSNLSHIKDFSFNISGNCSSDGLFARVATSGYYAPCNFFSKVIFKCACIPFNHSF